MATLPGSLSFLSSHCRQGAATLLLRHNVAYRPIHDSANLSSKKFFSLTHPTFHSEIHIMCDHHHHHSQHFLEDRLMRITPQNAPLMNGSAHHSTLVSGSSKTLSGLNNSSSETSISIFYVLYPKKAKQYFSGPSNYVFLGLIILRNS